jgi:Domain of unknown function (DUF3471)
MKPKLFAAAVLLSVPLAAQWLTYKTPGIPRTPDGKPNLSAPLPRAADGKPDLSGIWRAPRASVYLQDIAADLKPNEIQPWAQEVYQQHVFNLGADSPRAHCLPDPPPYYHLAGMARIVQTPGLVVIINEGISNNGVTRTIFTDGRGLPEDMDPAWLGYSVGRWDGDTLVVTTAGYNDKTWLDFSGHPHSDALRTTERFHRRDFGHMDFEMTLEDPKTFTRPVTFEANKTLVADTELLETICENEKIAPHLMGGTGMRLSSEALGKYAGTYEISPGRQAVVSVDGESLVLRMGEENLQVLAPQSETIFVARGNGAQVLTGDQVEFVKDASGAITGMTLHARRGEQKAVRKGAAR